MADAANEVPVRRPDTRAAVIDLLRHLEPEIRTRYLATALYLFGSAARDELNDRSDIDVFIDYDRAGSFSFVELIRLETFLASACGRDVDLGTRNGLHDELRAEIERTAVRVF